APVRRAVEEEHGRHQRPPEGEDRAVAGGAEAGESRQAHDLGARLYLVVARLPGRTADALRAGRRRPEPLALRGPALRRALPTHAGHARRAGTAGAAAPGR